MPKNRESYILATNFDLKGYFYMQESWILLLI